MQTCSTPAAGAACGPADPVGGIWSAWRSTGDLGPDVSVHSLYTVRVTLARQIDDLDEVLPAITARLSMFHLVLDEDHRGRTRLVLTLETPDLWQAILLAINAVTSTGYIPIILTAEPAAESEGERS